MSSVSSCEDDVTPTGSRKQSATDDLTFSLDNLSILVEDIKDGFALAMQQLANIQGQDDDLRSLLASTESNTKLRIETLQTAVDQMKDQFSGLAARVESLELHHSRLEGHVDRLDRVQTEQQDRLDNCQRHPVCEMESAACQTPIMRAPYSCPTPLSPDSGRSDTCTPSCYHGNEFLASSNDCSGPVSAQKETKIRGTNNLSSRTQLVAEQSLSMSRALAEQIGVVENCSVDCEFDNEERKTADEEHTNAGNAQINANTGLIGKTSEQLLDKRSRIYQEILDTERRYCSDLWTIIDLIAESLKSAGFISMNDLCLIFPKCLPRLYDLHSTFLGLLEARLSSSTVEVGGASPTQTTDFASIFLGFLDANNGELFELYKRYANDFGPAVRTIKNYQQHSGRFRCLQISLQRHPSCNGLDLTAFLLTPVQRLPRYLLLIRQLAVYTPTSHCERLGLDRLLSRLHSLLDQLNFSIQTALKLAQQQQQQQQQQRHQRQQQHQQRWKRSRSLNRYSTNCETASTDNSDAETIISGSGRLSPQTNGSAHFMTANSRCRSVTPSAVGSVDASAFASARSTSGSLSTFGGSQSALPHQTPARSPSMMGRRSRLISQHLRSFDRCLSASDILRSGDSGIAVSPSPSSVSAASPSPALAASPSPQLRRAGGRTSAAAASTAAMMQLQVSNRSTPTLKESFRRMFQSKRKSALAKMESLPAVNLNDTFEDENGEPCTDV